MEDRPIPISLPNDDLTKYQVIEEPTFTVTPENLSKHISSKKIKEFTAALEFLEQNQDLIPEYANSVIDFLDKSSPKILKLTTSILTNFFEQKKSAKKFNTTKAFKLILTKALLSARGDVHDQLLLLVKPIAQDLEKEDISEIIIKQLKESSPKKISAGLQVLEIIIKAYAQQKVAVVPITYELVSCIKIGAKKTKTEAFEVLKTLYNFFGELISPYTQDLPKFVLKDMNIYIESRKGAELEKPELAPEIEAFNLEEEIPSTEIFSKFKNKDCMKILQITKRQDKIAKLEEIEKMTNTRKIEKGDYNHLVNMLKQIIIDDTNVAIQAKVLQIFRNLSAGLKIGFRKGSRSILPEVVIRLRDKKKQISSIANETLEAFISSLHSDELMNELKKALNTKNQQLKIALLRFVEKWWFGEKAPNWDQILTEEKPKKIFMSLTKELFKLEKDSDKSVRALAEKFKELHKEQFEGNPHLKKSHKPTKSIEAIASGSKTDRKTEKNKKAEQREKRSMRPSQSVRSINKPKRKSLKTVPSSINIGKSTSRFTKNKKSKVEVSSTSDKEPASLEECFELLETRISRVKRDSIFVKSIEYIQTQEEIEKIFEIMNDKDDIKLSIKVKVYELIRKKTNLFDKNFLVVNGEKVFKSYKIKAAREELQTLLDHIYLDIGPIKFFKALESNYHSLNLFAGREGTIYLRLLLHFVEKTPVEFVQIKLLASLIRGFGYSGTTTEVLDLLCVFVQFLERRLDTRFELLEKDWVLLQLEENPDFLQIKERMAIDLEDFSVSAQAELSNYYGEKFDPIDLTQEITDFLKSSKKSLQKLEPYIFRSYKISCAPGPASKLIEYLAEVMDDKNKQTVRQALELSCLFLEHCNTQINFSRIFMNYIPKPVKHKNQDIRLKAIRVLKHLVKNHIKFFKFLIELVEGRDECISDLLTLILQLMDEDVRYVEKFDKKTGFTLILNLLSSKSKIVREKSEEVLARLMNHFERSDFDTYARDLPSAFKIRSKEVLDKLEEQKKEELEESIVLKQDKATVEQTGKYYLDLENLEVDFINKQGLKEIKPLASKHFHPELFEKLFSENKRKNLDGVKKISQLVTDIPKETLMAFGLICKIVSFLVKPESEEALAQEAAHLFARLIPLKKASDGIYRSQELYCLAELYISLVNSEKILIEELEILKEEVHNLVAYKTRESDYYISILKNKDYNVYKKIYMKEVHQLTPQVLNFQNKEEIKNDNFLSIENSFSKKNELSPARSIEKQSSPVADYIIAEKPGSVDPHFEDTSLLDESKIFLIKLMLTR